MYLVVFEVRGDDYYDDDNDDNDDDHDDVMMNRVGEYIFSIQLKLVYTIQFKTLIVYILPKFPCYCLNPDIL